MDMSKNPLRTWRSHRSTHQNPPDKTRSDHLDFLSSWIVITKCRAAVPPRLIDPHKHENSESQKTFPRFSELPGLCRHLLQERIHGLPQAHSWRHRSCLAGRRQPLTSFNHFHLFARKLSMKRNGKTKFLDSPCPTKQLFKQPKVCVFKTYTKKRPQCRPALTHRWCPQPTEYDL